jgi:hypothetical protein
MDEETRWNVLMRSSRWSVDAIGWESDVFGSFAMGDSADLFWTTQAFNWTAFEEVMS